MRKKTVTLLAVLAASLSFTALSAEATHPAPGEEMYEASASTTVKAPAPAPNRRHTAPGLNDATGKAERVGGVRWTIHDGIIYDAKKLLADVRTMISDAKAKEAAQPGATH